MSGVVVKTVLVNGGIKPTKTDISRPGFDLFSNENGTIAPGERKTIKTGVRLCFPNDVFGMIVTRAISSSDDLIDVVSKIVDSSCMDEVIVTLINHSPTTFSYSVGDPIAQFITMRSWFCNFEEAETF